mmetsp:Transcript_16666/g.15958  ORF Transcript_16666/g.15958 Transcript_16666/m.15958 type:complete len:136 (-) Transcript_16666:621-1028(-)
MEGLEQEQESEFDLNLMTKWFAKWKDSSPIGMGKTIGAAFEQAQEANPDYSALFKVAGEKNQASQSNGCLARLVPLSIWCKNLNEPLIKQVVYFETRLTHYQYFTQEACFLYTLAIKYLLHNHSQSPEEKVEKAF